jgi:hypothetical protein
MLQCQKILAIPQRRQARPIPLCRYIDAILTKDIGYTCENE